MSEKLTDEMVLRVARLARLKLGAHELQILAPQLNQILDFVAQLERVDSSQVTPMVHAIELTNVFRADEPAPCLPREETLQNAPQSDGRYFLVPPILHS